MRHTIVLIIALMAISSWPLLGQSDIRDRLGDYVSIADCPAALGVNMKFRPPKGWTELSSDELQPIVVKQYQNGTSFIKIQITEAETFISRKEFLSMSDDFFSRMIQSIKSDSSHNRVDIGPRFTTIVDKYPFLVLMASFNVATLSFYYPSLLHYYLTCYEDKLIMVIAGDYVMTYPDDLNDLIDGVVFSIKFPDQYL